jgi:diphthamide synthase (EF-2-diphthine--ammonia ligase)
VVKMSGTGIEPTFPLWGRDTSQLAAEMLAAGLRATLTCVDPRCLDRDFAGRTFDQVLLNALPAGVDPWGEKGEFHTFVSAGPMFGAQLEVVVGEVVAREGFVFADVLPAGDALLPSP